MKKSVLPLFAAIWLTACAHPVLLGTAGGPLGVSAPARPELSQAAAAPNSAALVVEFSAAGGRKVQDLPNANYEIRAMYTDAVVRSPALLADFHVGVKAMPNSLSGYSLNVPSPGSPAPAGAPRLRYAQHTVVDDPYFPSLVDFTRMLNPTTDEGIYFLGQGILKTAHTAGFPTPLLDPFMDGVSSQPVGSFNDVQSAKLGVAAVETSLNNVFQGVTYDDPSGNHAAAPVIQDRALTDNTTVTTTRYYKWVLPFAATSLNLGTTLPLGRLILDIRLIDSLGRNVASGATARELQSGTNALNVQMRYDAQGFVSAMELNLAAISDVAVVPPPPIPPVLGPLAGDLVAPYPAGSGPAALAIAQNGDVWVANATGGTVSHLNSDGSLVDTYNGATEPRDVAIDSYGDIWIADAASDVVHRIATDLTLRDVVSVGDSPEALAVDAGGDIWVGNAGDGTITKIQDDGLVLGTFTVGGTPADLRLDATGKIWVADRTGNQFTVLSGAGAIDATYPAASGPTGLAFDLWDRLWAALNTSGRLGVFTGGALDDDYPLGGARKVAIDAGQTAWTTSETSNLVAIRAWDGTEYGSAATSPGPRDVAIDDYRASVWVTEYGAGAGDYVKKLSTGLLLSQGSTLAGSPVSGFLDASGAAARFWSPEGVAIDGAGYTYVADSKNHRIRKIAPGGSVSTLAGSGTPGWTDGPGIQARFTDPAGIAVDGAGTVYVADRGSHTIRKITPAGYVTTLAGSGQAGYLDAIGQIARFDGPTGIAITTGGTVYVSETSQHRLRKITAGGVTTTFAAGGLGFSSPRGLAMDSAGNLLVADSGWHDIRKVTPGGTVTVLSGNGTAGYVNGPVAGARFSNPVGVCFDSSDNLYVNDQGNRVIRRISPTGIVTTIGGDGFGGNVDGHPLKMRFQAPSQIALNAAGTMVVADTGNHEIRKLAKPGPLPAYAALGGPTVSTLASLSEPYGLAVTSGGNLIATQIGYHTVRTVTAGGAVGLLSGTSGTSGYVDGTLAGSLFYRPAYPAVDAAGNVYVGDQNYRVRLIDIPGDAVTTAAGTGSAPGGYVDGNATESAMIRLPLGMAVDAAGDVYFADFNNNLIRKLDNTTGMVSTYAGTAFSAGGTDGPPGTGKLNGPHGLAIDAAGNLYTADFWGHTVRKILPGGSIVTIAGAAGSAGYVDGPAGPARFNLPTGVAVDAAGSVYVSDSLNHRIRKIDTSGLVTTYAGSGPVGGAGAYGNGVALGAQFNVPMGLAMSPAGVLYVADYANNRIRKITP